MHSTLSENTLLAALQILNDDTEQIKSSACLRRCSSISLVSLLSFFAVYRLLGMLLMFISCSDRCQPDPNLLPEQNAVRTAGVIVLILGIIGVFGELPLAMLKGLSHEDCRLACRHVAALYHPYTFSKCALRSLLVDNAGVLVGNILGLLSGILCIVAGSLVVCCAPLNQTQGHDQYHAAGYCGLVAMGIDIGSMIWVFVLMILFFSEEEFGYAVYTIWLLALYAVIVVVSALPGCDFVMPICLSLRAPHRQLARSDKISHAQVKHYLASGEARPRVCIHAASDVIVYMCACIISCRSFSTVSRRRRSKPRRLCATRRARRWGPRPPCLWRSPRRRRR
mmetsp:Transcript_16652/g.32577  ORF Transcript_16652/g.32577 Transcript_16652/m.32577 type:complete len:338 (+) Transcript_16652:280-1293(+)